MPAVVGFESGGFTRRGIASFFLHHPERINDRALRRAELHRDRHFAILTKDWFFVGKLRLNELEHDEGLTRRSIP